ncbi:bifunctional deaminase-reductase-like protein [Calothrix sp. NIES-2100]|nr:bifunctional deaminase-reductase-like protein [Calothrix sp. NIES-2100]
MRKIRLFIAASLDEYIARKSGDVDWLFTDQDYGYTQYFSVKRKKGNGKGEGENFYHLTFPLYLLQSFTYFGLIPNPITVFVNSCLSNYIRNFFSVFNMVECFLFPIGFIDNEVSGDCNVIASNVW